MISSAELRSLFLNYFKLKGHEVVSSGSLVPHNDPSLLFTNAGMVPFKNVFLGQDMPSYTRATSSQRCVRAGGKHNDLDQVGYTARHHTFFEMLGNFSFGDYFKREAIQYAWEFLTKELKLPEERLWITVYKDDDETADIWLKEMKIDPSRFSRCGAADNFWSMGDTGPCGPCTEIFYDHGADIPGGPPGSVEQEADRYIEIWNLVFMQYDRSSSGELNPLPKPSVDTGMGLERLTAVMQGVHNNYDTDLFQGVLQALVKLSGINDSTHTSMRVVADHIRSCAFLIVDGVVPSNEGRGYVLRRIIRRAIRHGHKLGLKETFFHTLVDPLIKIMGEAYPELTKAKKQIIATLKKEEIQFEKTLEQGLKILEQDIAHLKSSLIPGETVFRLYDTYGFPADLTADIARERGLQLDLPGFEQAMQRQREQSQEASGFTELYGDALDIDAETAFMGYEHLEYKAKVLSLYREGKSVEALEENEEGMVFLDNTPFYAESGGQVGDQGLLDSGSAIFEVKDTQQQKKAIAHCGKVRKGRLQVNDSIIANVALDARQATVRNHSATHLLHAALRSVLGEHVTQKGSLVAPERLRFDFSHNQPLTPEEQQVIEDRVNHQILANVAAETNIMEPEEAMNQGAMALFGEKYDEKVRVLSLGTFSKELCGGTHVNSTGDIGLFKITSESGVAAGIRRIEAITGTAALAWVGNIDKQLSAIAGLLKAEPNKLLEKLNQVLTEKRTLEKDYERLQARVAMQGGADLASQAVVIHGVNVLAVKIDGVDVKALRQTLDQLKNKLGSAAIVLATVQNNSVNLVAGVTKDYTDRIQAGKLVNFVAEQVGGKGGGRPDMAQAGGTAPSNIDAALASVSDWVLKQLS